MNHIATVSRPIPRVVYVLLLLTMGFYCLDYFFRISPSLVLVPLMQQYHTTPLGMGVFASMFYLGYVIFQIPSGLLLDRYPFQYPLAILTLLCTATFLGFIAGHSFWWGMVLRVLLGVTSAASFVGVLYIARCYLPMRFFAFISGVTIAAGTLDASLIQTLNAWLMQWFSWRWVLGCFSLVGVVIGVSLLWLKPPARQALPSLYPRAPSLSALLRSLWRLLKNGRLMLNGVIGGLFYLPTSLLTAVWGIAFFESAYHVTATQASTGIFLIFLGWAIGSPLIGWLGGRWRSVQGLAMVCAALAAGMSALILFEARWLQHGLFWAVFLFGLFSSAQVLVWQNFNTLCPPEVSGVGIALTNMVIMLVVSVSHALVGDWINRGFHQDGGLTTQAYLAGLHCIPWVFGVVVILQLGMIVMKL